MQTLSYGYKLPENGDKGTPLWQALEFDISRLNGHNHDGSNSAPLTAQSIVGISQNISAAGWGAYGPTGHYRQLVTMLPGFDFDKVFISFRTAAGVYVTPTVEKFSATEFYIYSIDNTLNLVAVYGG
jgi:hypothetical protein